MKVGLFLTGLYLLSVQIAYPANSWRIKTGISASRFWTVDSQVNFGPIISIGKEWFVSDRVSISAEAMYAVRGSVIKNKEIGYSESQYLYMNDIHFSMGFLHLQTSIRLNFPIMQRMKMIILAGPILSVGIWDYSDIRNGRFIRNLEYQHDYQFDYHWNRDSGFWYTCASSGFGLVAGVGLQYRRFCIECCYYRDLSKIDTAADVFLHEKLHSLYLLLGISL